MLTALIRRFLYERKDNSRVARILYTALRQSKVRQTRRINVAMFHIGRCGSTVLGDMLNQHPEIDWGSELFSDFANRYPKKSGKLRAASNIIRDSMIRSNKSAYGFETNYLPEQQLGRDGVDIQLSDYVEFLKNNGFSHFIILHRKNYLRRALSVQVGVQKGVWHSKNKIGTPNKVRLPVAGISHWFDTIDKSYETLQSILKLDPHIVINFRGRYPSKPSGILQKRL